MPVFVINFWNWLTKNAWAQALLAGLATVFALKVIKDRWQSNIEKGVRRIEREQAERVAAQREAQIVSTISENSREYIRKSDAVRSHDFARQLPNEAGATLPPENYRD